MQDPGVAAFFGASAAAGPEVYLWPCNLRAWAAWCALQTQWRTGGMGGRTGLDYTAVLAWLQQVERLRGRQLHDALDAIRAAEAAVLEVDAEQRATEV